MRRWKLFHIHKLKTKLTIEYSLIFIVVITLSLGLTYLSIKNAILKSVDSSLTMQIGLIKNSIETSADAAIKNYFRATARASYDIVNACYQKQQQGLLDETAAKNLAWQILSKQQLGVNGYVVVMNSTHQIILHPDKNLIHSDADQFEFTNQIFDRNETFIAYQWQDQTTLVKNDKALYSIFFKEWDWYITITGYKSEFLSLVNLNDFKDKILSIKFGETGYPLVLDYKGNLLIHPEYEGINMYNRKDSMGEVTRKAILERNGRAEYFWKNPNETAYRKKVTVYNDIPQYGWIVAATAYESEFLKPLRTIERLFIICLFASLLLIVVLTFKISKRITSPIEAIKSDMSKAADGDLTVLSHLEATDEIGEIGVYFNRLMHSLNSSQEELKSQIQLNMDTADELRAALTDLQETQQRLIEEERFSNMGRLVVKISHHLNTPIGTAMTAITFLEKENKLISEQNDQQAVTKKGLRDYLSLSSEVIQSVSHTLHNAITLVNAFKKLHLDIDLETTSHISLLPYIQQYCASRWQTVMPDNIEISVIGDSSITAKISPQLIETIMDNFISNTLVHGIPENQPGHIEVNIVETSTAIQIIYIDNGYGIPKSDADRIFEPFYSPTPQIASIGLGLSIVYNAVVGSLKGNIAYEGDLGIGVKFVISLPKNIDA